MNTMSNPVVYDDVDDLPLELMSKHVKGIAFLQMIRDAAMGDIRMLTALNDAQRFKISSAEVLAAPTGFSSLLSKDAVSVVDSLAAVVVAHTHQQQLEFGQDSLADSASAPCWSTKLSTSLELQNLVKRICNEMLDDLAVFSSSEEIDYSSAAEEDRAALRVSASRGVIAAVACALDDGPLLARCAMEGGQASLDTPLQQVGLIPSGLRHSVEFFCGAYAVVFGSQNCLQALGAEGLNRLQTIAFNPEIAEGDDARNWSPLLLMTHISPRGGPSVDVMASVLHGLQDADGRFPKSAASLLSGQALSLIARGNPRLIDPVVDSGLAVADLDVCKRVAFGFGIPALAAQFLDRAPDEMIPPPVRHGSGRSWFPEYHPVSELISSFKSEWDSDSTLALLVNSMAARGRMDELIHATDESLVTFAEHLIINEMPMAMVAMLANGLDPFMRTSGSSSQSLLELAENEHANKRGPFVDMLRAAIARAAAHDALRDIGLEGSSKTLRIAA